MSDEKLIGLVREHEELYNSSSPKYGDTTHKDRVWKNIGLRLDKSGPDCKRRWCSLRDQYRRYVRKCSADGVPDKKWKFEEEISFIRRYVRERNSRILFGGAAGSGDEFADSNPGGPTLEGEGEGEGEGEREEGESKPSNNTVRPSSVPPVARGVPESPSDPLSAFFAGIQASVRTFSPYYGNIAKARIFNVVSELELAQIMENSDTSREPRVPDPHLPAKHDPDG